MSFHKQYGIDTPKSLSELDQIADRLRIILGDVFDFHLGPKKQVKLREATARFLGFENGYQQLKSAIDKFYEAVQGWEKVLWGLIRQGYIDEKVVHDHLTEQVIEHGFNEQINQDLDAQLEALYCPFYGLGDVLMDMVCENSGFSPQFIDQCVIEASGPDYKHDEFFDVRWFFQ